MTGQGKPQCNLSKNQVNQAIKIIEEIGFESIGITPSQDVELREEVRDMCASCRVYGTNWSCPPACGELEVFRELFNAYETCLVFQTLGQTDGSFDIDAMLEIEAKHKTRVFRLLHKISKEIPGSKVFSAGSCTLCESCTYPNEPCVYPEKQMVSLEAAGIVVTDLCKLAGIPYNHGKNTMSYIGCALI